ncbi:hypothetical protein, conserved [Leishmania tarentolae]|uniref:Uncharacterized protein n=1 Tax=Leishmania tarentolae TaxID=5689 RepID=A0A640KRI2_LEITA|nr:hypothetical protein, conserved [Leishmania tarentolae]
MPKRPLCREGSRVFDVLFFVSIHELVSTSPAAGCSLSHPPAFRVAQRFALVYIRSTVALAFVTHTHTHTHTHAVNQHFEPALRAFFPFLSPSSSATVASAGAFGRRRRLPPLMPAKKKSKKADASKKEVLPDPATIKDGTSTVFIGDWSSYDTLESMCHVSRSVIAANTGADGVVAAPLPRTNVLVLPTEDSDNDTDSGEAQAPFVVEVADQLFVEGVSRRQCAQAQSLVKTWAPASLQPTEATEPNEQPTTPAPKEEPVNPYADVLSDERYTQEVSVGASYAARDVVIRGPCSIEGVAPIIVIPPQLPAKPDLDAVTLDPPADNPSTGAGASNKKKENNEGQKEVKTEADARASGGAGEEKGGAGGSIHSANGGGSAARKGGVGLPYDVCPSRPLGECGVPQHDVSRYCRGAPRPRLVSKLPFCWQHCDSHVQSTAPPRQSVLPGAVHQVQL